VVPSLSLYLIENNILDNIPHNKSEFRKLFRDRRDRFHHALDPAAKTLAFRRVPSPVLGHIPVDKTIGLYVATGSEAPTHHLIEYFLEAGYAVALPRIAAQSTMEFRAYGLSDQLTKGFAAIPEPSSDSSPSHPDVIFAPLLAFDRALNRLGQGGGHYDRIFTKYPDALRIGLAWSAQETEHIPHESHDIPLHMIITECELIERAQS